MSRPWPFLGVDRPSFKLVHEYPYAIMLKTEEEEVYNQSRRNRKKKLLM